MLPLHYPVIYFIFVVPQGFEPRLREPKSRVLTDYTIGQLQTTCIICSIHYLKPFKLLCVVLVFCL